MTLQTSTDVGAGYDGVGAIRLYLMADSAGADQFDETTLTWDALTTAGLAADGNPLSADRITGVVASEVATPATAAGQSIDFALSAAALTDLANDTNGFLTFVAEFRSETPGSGYGSYTGVGFESKELSGGTPASLTFEVVPEPGSIALLGLGGLLIARRRRG